MLLQQPPPRPAPKGLKSALITKMLFPFGFFFLIGLVFTLVGFGALTIFFPWQAGKELKLSSGKKSNAFAMVSSSEDSGYEDVNSKVYKINYEFQTPDGKAHQGYSYSTGTEVPQDSKVQVEYLTDDPEINRIPGMGLNPAGYFILYFCAFPVIGLGIVFFLGRSALRDWSKSNRLFENGMLTQGLIKSIDKTKLNVNRQSRYKITVSYMQSETAYYVYGDGAVAPSKWQGAKTPMRVLYNPEKPEDSVVVESIFKS